MKSDRIAKLLLEMTERYTPETVALGDWQKPVAEAVASYITMHVQDTERLPSVNEYAEMCRHAIETACLPRSTRGRG